jgi:hypothetical protein
LFFSDAAVPERIEPSIFMYFIVCFILKNLFCFLIVNVVY